MPSVAEIMTGYPYGEENKRLLVRRVNIHELNGLPRIALAVKRRKLANLLHDKYGHEMNLSKETRILITGTIFVVSQLMKHMAPERIPSDDHRLTDHAFCRILQRGCGVDMKKVKDLALQKAKETGLIPVERDGTYVTFLARDE